MPEGKFVWLHLSDWHQKGRDFDRRAVRDALLDDLKNRASIDERLAEIDFIVFSGDLAFSGASEEYESAAKELLSPVLEATNVPKNRLFIVPGNHDLERTNLRLLGSWLQLFKTSAEVNAALLNLSDRAVLLHPLKAYTEFVRGFWGPEAVPEPAYSFVAPFEIRGVRFAVLGMNSAWMCGQHIEKDEVADYGYLILGEPQYYDGIRETTFRDADVRLGVLHHPFSWLGEVVSRRAVEQVLSQACHFLLRGHEHESRLTISTGPEGNCAILSAGATYDRREYPNGYNFVHLDLDAGRGVAFLRRYDRLRGFHNDTVTTGDGTPGFHRFVLPKGLGRSAAPAAPVPVARREPEPALAVERIRDRCSPDIFPALGLYNERIPESERVEPEDFMRWLGDYDYLFVAKRQNHVCGFTQLHTGPQRTLAFIAYLVAEKMKRKAVDDGTISSDLMKEVAKLFSPTGELAHCEAILLEVDDPRKATNEKELQQRVARIRLFCMLARRENFCLRALDFDYRQPLLHVPAAGERGQEVPMLLMVALRLPVSGDGSLSGQRVRGLLEFVYQWLYPSEFSEIEAENEAYGRYLATLYIDQIASLPDSVPTLGPAQIRAR
jgi:predicted phosphodiesterase